MKQVSNEAVKGAQSKFALLVAVLAVVVASYPYMARLYATYASHAHDHAIQSHSLQLISSPERYDGALVSFFGWCVNRFEQTSVQVSADRKDWILALWLELNESQSASVYAQEPTFCRVKGTFRSGWAGHMGRWPAQISPVEDIIVYAERAADENAADENAADEERENEEREN